MEFKNIHHDSCKCLDDAVQKPADHFTRKVGAAKTPKERDFRTDLERGKVLENDAACDDVCGHRGLSVEIWNETSKDVLLSKYQTTASISPKLKNHLFVFKIQPDSGLLRYTPNQRSGNNPFHYDFFKEDSFKLDMFEKISMIALKS